MVNFNRFSRMVAKASMVAGLFLIHTSAQADGLNELQAEASSFGGGMLPQGVKPFIGLEAGGMDYDLDSLSGLEGAQTGILGGISYYSQSSPWVTDTMVGVQQSFRNGFQEGIVEGGRTTTARLEVAPQYRFARQWMIGPRIASYFGNGRELGDASNDVTGFAGLGIARDFYTKSTTIRAAIKGMSDLNIAGKTATIGLFTIQVGFGGLGGNTSVVENRIDTEEMEAIENEFAAMEAEPQAVEASSVSLDLQELAPIMTFKPGSTLLSNVQKSKMQKLAQALKNNSHLFEKVAIKGHADQTGSAQINSIISAERAQQAQDVFVSQGFAQDQIATTGVSDTEPVSSYDNALNRRVEISLEGVTDESALQSLISETL